MKQIAAVALGLSMVVALPVTLSAKGHVVKIVVEGLGLKTPLEITSSNIGQFHVWAGPGVRINGVEQTEGFIIDWSKGVVAGRPVGLRHYEVFFYSGCPSSQTGCREDEPSSVYTVSYEYDPEKQDGFVYLPGRNDDAFKFNYVMWHGHDYEGHWMHATSAWESFIRPLLAEPKPATAN